MEARRHHGVAVVWFVRKKWLGPGDDRFYVVRSRRARNHSSFIRKHMRPPLKSSKVIAFHSLSILSPDFTCHSRLMSAHGAWEFIGR